MQEKRHDRVVEMRLCFFSGKVGDYKMLFVATRKCRSTADSVEIISEAVPEAEISDDIFDCYEEDASSSQEEIQSWAAGLGY